MKAQNNGSDPAEKITLPSYVNHVYRAYNMPENSLAILPPRLVHIGSLYLAFSFCLFRGYNQRGMQSLEALTWLLWQSKQLGLPILHGRNGDEVKIGPYYVDGFSKTRSQSSVCFEFNGSVLAYS